MASGDAAGSRISFVECNRTQDGCKNCKEYIIFIVLFFVHFFAIPCFDDFYISGVER